MNSINDIWQSVLEHLAAQLTPTAMKTWFEDVTPIAIDENRLVVHTASEFKATIIVSRYSDMIKTVLSEIFSQDFELQVLSGEELEEYRAKRKADNNLPEMQDYTFDRFIVGNSNRFAHAAAVSVAKNPGKTYNPLFIYGNSGLGKTHLLLAIGQYIHEHEPEKSICYIKGDDFTVQMVRSIKEGSGEEFRNKYRNVDLFLVDDIQFIAGKPATQNEFFHTFNSIYEAGHQIVITSDRPPLEMSLLDDRLRTRFEGGLMADIQPPDLETRMAITRNKASQLGLMLSDDAVTFIAESITSNIRQLEGVIKKLTAYKEILNDVIDTDSVRRAIKDVVRDGTNIPTPEVIIRETARYFSFEESELKGQNRSKYVTRARQISMYLIRTLTSLSLQEIGAQYQDRNHATVLTSIRKIEELLGSDPSMRETIRNITSNINS
ncbi:MAG: chromosomal replication initiator protein DnaA [Oscillospiraceae bacterium]|nr:chromosomal replication initiator protein DnaA [Oscillospiraceae bacterium]